MLKKLNKKNSKLNEEQILHLETIEHLENEVCKGNISNEQFFNNMDNLKEVFKD